MANKTDQFGFVEVLNKYWVPEEVGEQLTGVLVAMETTDTVHGEADVAVIADLETGEETRLVVGGGLSQLPKQMKKLVRITYEGVKENPNPKRGRSKTFKAYKLEVATKFDYNAWALSQDE